MNSNIAKQFANYRNHRLLENKVALITGASSGIGRASAYIFALEGAKVLVSGRRKAELESLLCEIEELGGEAYALAGDVTDESYAESLVNTAVEYFGGLDIAFNNVGTLGVTETSIPELTLDDWMTTINTNLTSAFLGGKYQIPAMIQRGKGSIIFTSSFVGHSAALPQMAAYAASKSGIIGLMQALAVEFSSENIRVNALVPGGTDTAMREIFASTAEELEFVKSLHAMKRLAEPIEIAHAALYLASDLSSFTTGSVLYADGGVSISKV